MLLHDEGIRDGFEIGAEVVDMGIGTSEFKSRLSDVDEPIAWTTLLVRDARYPLARARNNARSVAGGAAAALGRLLPPEARRRINRARRRA